MRASHGTHAPSDHTDLSCGQGVRTPHCTCPFLFIAHTHAGLALFNHHHGSALPRHVRRTALLPCPAQPHARPAGLKCLLHAPQSGPVLGSRARPGAAAAAPCQSPKIGAHFAFCEDCFFFLSFLWCPVARRMTPSGRVLVGSPLAGRAIDISVLWCGPKPRCVPRVSHKTAYVTEFKT